jgi:hypothetical protein
VADASGNGNAGTVVNGPLTFGAMGANFNGQQYVDSTLTMTSLALTVSVWFNAANLSKRQPAARRQFPHRCRRQRLPTHVQQRRRVRFLRCRATAPPRAAHPGSQQLVEGTWYHYVGVYNGATVGAYLNGVQ